MDPRNINISVSSTDEAGRTTSFDASFDGVALPWSELNGVFNAASVQIRDLTHVAPVKSQGMAAPVPKEHIAKDFGVANMTPGEVQALLERQDRFIEELKQDKEKLIANLDIARQERDTQKDLRNEANRRSDAVEEECGHLRAAITSMQDELKKRAELDGIIVKLEADLKVCRKNIEDLKQMNENQKKTIKEQRAKLRSADGAPGVADLQERCNDLHTALANLATEDTALQRKLTKAQADNAELRLQNAALKEDANKRIDKHVEQLDAAEKRFQELKKDAETQAEAIGKRITDAVQSAKEDVMSDESQRDSWMIHKTDANETIDGVLKRLLAGGISF